MTVPYVSSNKTLINPVNLINHTSNTALRKFTLELIQSPPFDNSSSLCHDVIFACIELDFTVRVHRENSRRTCFASYLGVIPNLTISET